MLMDYFKVMVYNQEIVFWFAGWVKCGRVRITSIRTCLLRREGSSLESSVRTTLS
jgi:hypothetical protein